MSSDVRIRHNHTPSDRADPDQSKSDQRASDDRIRTYSAHGQTPERVLAWGDAMAELGSEGTQEPPAPNSGTDFFEDMRVLIERRRAARPGSEGRGNLRARLAARWRSMVKTMKRPGPLPSRIQEKVDEVTAKMRQLPTAADVRALSAEIQAEEYPGVHPILEVLIREDFEHLERKFGRAVAKQAFDELFGSLAPSRRPGRPQVFPLEMVQKMKALKDRGQTYGQIGAQLDVDRQQVRMRPEPAGRARM